MNSGRSIFEMGSDYFREASVLVAVFGFLEKALGELPVSVGYALKVLGVSVLLFVVGYFMETRRAR